jgi:hypothetical protein
LTLHFLGRPLDGWRLLSEEDELVLSSSDWKQRHEPGTMEVAWQSERPPSGLWVKWPASGSRSWWPVEVLSPEALIPLEELRNLPLEILIRVLTSSQPLHRVLAAEIRRRREVERHSGRDQVVTDPHKKVDVSGFLLQRSRRVAEAVDALCARLSKPTVSEACLYWKIHGPVGVKSLAEALVKEAKSAEERAFLLTEVALGLARLKLEVAPGALPEAVVRKRLTEVIAEIKSDIPSGGLAQVPHLSQYIQRAWEVAQW